MELITTIVIFLVMLSILVFVHELGHFLVAKKFKMGVEEFGFGLPPRIWGKKIGETLYSINWLPIGGFVKLSGEDQVEGDRGKHKDTKDRNKMFYARPKWQRAAVLLAGVTMNFLLAVAILTFIFTHGVYVPTERVHIDKIVENSPAALAGLEEQDIVLSIDDKSLKTTEDLILSVNEKKDAPVKLVIERAGQQREFVLQAQKDVDETGQENWRLGVVISNYEERKYPFYTAPYHGLVEAVKQSGFMLTELGKMLYRLVTFQRARLDVAGPIGIAQVTGEAIKFGYIAVLQLMGVLSLNLAIFNILPIPALDGGRLFFVVFEKWLGKHVKPQAEALAHQIGMLFLIGLILLVTINDILRILRN